MSKHDKKIFLIRVVGGAAFLLGGAIFGIVALALYGWDFVKFISNPTVDLIILLCLALGVICFANMEVK